MKKHVFIWGLVLIACGLFALFLFNPFSTDEKDKKTTISASDIDARIEAFGNGKYKHEDYLNLKLGISSLRSNGKISNDHAESIRLNLENARQKALSTSMREWFANNCGSSEMHQLFAYAKEVSQPSAELSKEINHYQQYSKAIEYKINLRNFLNSACTPNSADDFNSKFKNLTNGKPFQNCPKIISVGAEISRELNAFKSFYKDVINIYLIPIIKEDPNKINSAQINRTKLFFDMSSNEKDQLMKYNFYFNQYLNRVDNDSEL